MLWSRHEMIHLVACSFNVSSLIGRCWRLQEKGCSRLAYLLPFTLLSYKPLLSGCYLLLSASVLGALAACC
jgi:hypothetical protein